MRLPLRLAVALSLALAPAAATAGPDRAAATARASVKVSIAADVSASSRAQAAAGDKAYAAGDMEAALAAYGQGFAATRDTAYVYAMARAHEAMGHQAEARAMFQMYLGASNQASLTYKGEAQAAAGASASAGASAGAASAGAVKGTVGAVAGLGSRTATATTAAVADVGAGVYGAVKLSIAAQVSASAKAKAKAADSAYAAGKYQEAATGYLEAYAQAQQPVALYAAAQAHAQAGDAVRARALLQGYLAAQPKGAHAKDAGTLLLALGGNARASSTARLDTGVAAGDAAFRAGKYLDAARAYTAAHAKAQTNATLLYARGTAHLHAGNIAEARKDLEAYLATGGKLQFEAEARASLRATARAEG